MTPQGSARPVPQSKPVIVEEEDGTVYTCQLGVDEIHQTIEHLLKRGAHRDHFEDLCLPIAQGVCKLARGNVA